MDYLENTFDASDYAGDIAGPGQYMPLGNANGDTGRRAAQLRVRQMTKKQYANRWRYKGKKRIK